MASSNTDMKACMKLIAEWATDKEDSFPPHLKELLIKVGFPRVSVTERTPPVLLQPYEARMHDKIQVQAQTAATPDVLNKYPDAERFQAHVVPMVRHSSTGEAIKTFPRGYFVAVDLKAPGARVVVTGQLTGCSFVIASDKRKKDRVLLGHAQPKSTPAGAGQPSNRAQLAKHFNDANGKSIFEGEEVKEVYVVGGDSKGYGDDSADVLGWISGGKFFLALMTRSDRKKLAVHKYPPSFTDRFRKN